MPTRWRDNPWLVAAVLIAVTVAIGGISFLFTGVFSSLTRPRSGAATSRLAPTELMRIANGPTKLLSLPWGSGAGSSVNETVQYAFVSAGSVYVADTDPRTLLPRVRWFDRSGALLGSYGCPVGATDFAPYSGGFSFVIAPAATGGKEVAAAYSVQGSTLTTYALPTALSSAGLVEREGITYSQVDESVFDIEAQKVTIQGKLVPIADHGEQLDQKTASEGVLDARYIGANGKLYGRVLHMTSVQGGTQTQAIRDVESSRTLEVPPNGEFLGVDGQGRAYVRIKGERDTSPPETAGISRKSDAVSLVLIAEMGGKGRQWVLPVQTPHPFPYAARLFAVDADGLVAVRATEQGIDVLSYKGGVQ